MTYLVERYVDDPELWLRERFINPVGMQADTPMGSGTVLEIYSMRINRFQGYLWDAYSLWSMPIFKIKSEKGDGIFYYCPKTFKWVDVRNCVLDD